MTIPENHLRACPNHRLVDDHDHVCPACSADATPKPDAVADAEFLDTHMRQQIVDSTLADLMPLLEQEAERVDGEAYVAVAEMDAGEGGGAFIEDAAGYTNQERWFNVAVIEYGNNQREILKRELDAQKALKTLEEGEPYIEETVYEYDRLEPDEWETAVLPYVYKFSHGRVDEDTLALVIGTNSPTKYSNARKQLTVYADLIDANVRTVEKDEDWVGNVEALIEVTV